MSDYPINLNSCILFFLCLSLTSCINTKIVGDSSTTLPKAKGQNVIYVDYCDIGRAEIKKDWITYLEGYELEYDFLFCVKTPMDELNENCIRQSTDSLSSDIVIVSYLISRKEGSHLNFTQKHPYHTGDSKEETRHRASVQFDVYSGKTSEKISSFQATTTISALSFKNDKKEKSTDINALSSSSAIRKARKKGLKNILRRIKEF